MWGVACGNLDKQKRERMERGRHTMEVPEIFLVAYVVADHQRLILERADWVGETHVDTSDPRTGHFLPRSKDINDSTIIRERSPRIENRRCL